MQEAVSARKSEVAVWLREGLVRLGPTFIKIGQQFSTRVDVLAPEFIKELEKLQVSAFWVHFMARFLVHFLHAFGALNTLYGGLRAGLWTQPALWARGACRCHM